MLLLLLLLHWMRHSRMDCVPVAVPFFFGGAAFGMAWVRVAPTTSKRVLRIFPQLTSLLEMPSTNRTAALQHYCETTTAPPQPNYSPTAAE